VVSPNLPRRFTSIALVRDKEKWNPVFLQNRATSKDSRVATELWFFRRK